MTDRRPTPDDLRVSWLRVGDDDLMVVSHPARTPCFETTPLTDAETEVAALAVRGLSNAEIAEARGTAVRTVANQMASILHKLQLASRHQLATRFVHGCLDD